jgi:hypothetical protein
MNAQQVMSPNGQIRAVELRPDNYAVWKLRVEDLFDEKELTDHLDGTASAASQDPVIVAAFKKQEQRALRLIRSTLGDTYLPTVAHCSTANEILVLLQGDLEKD